MAFDLLAAITFIVLVLGFILQIDDDRTVAFRARFRARIGRGREAVMGSRTALTRTVRLQQAGLTDDPSGPGPAELSGADLLDGPQLRKMTRSQVAELGAALGATEDDPGNPGRDRALACYDAAALLVAERKDRLDLLGALVLAREGQTALADRDPHPRPVCQVHPLHGPAVRRRRGRRPQLARKPRAMCAGCAGCSSPERDQRALLEDGVPYYRTTGFWVQVGFGALDAELPARVLEYLGVE